MPEFAACLNCMDGRAQLPVINYLENNYSIDYVDMITEAGMDGFIVNHDILPSDILHKINISIEKHGSDHIFIVGHYDCGGHPVDDNTHKEHIKISVNKIKDIYPDKEVIGLWLSEKWDVEKIC